MKTISGQVNAKGKKVAIIVSRWNELITKQLLEGAIDALAAHGDPDVLVVHTPGTWEMPPVAARLIAQGKVDGVVALGCILQGATTHAQLLAGDVSSALMRLQTESGIPIGWGILTPENAEQGLDRAGLKMGNKGREAALAVVEMMSVLPALEK